MSASALSAVRGSVAKDRSANNAVARAVAVFIAFESYSQPQIEARGDFQWLVENPNEWTGR